MEQPNKRPDILAVVEGENGQEQVGINPAFESTLKEGERVIISLKNAINGYNQWERSGGSVEEVVAHYNLIASGDQEKLKNVLWNYLKE